MTTHPTINTDKPNNKPTTVSSMRQHRGSDYSSQLNNNWNVKKNTHTCTTITSSTQQHEHIFVKCCKTFFSRKIFHTEINLWACVHVWTGFGCCCCHKFPLDTCHLQVCIDRSINGYFAYIFLCVILLMLLLPRFFIRIFFCLFGCLFFARRKSMNIKKIYIFFPVSLGNWTLINAELIEYLKWCEFIYINWLVQLKQVRIIDLFASAQFG